MNKARLLVVGTVSNCSDTVEQDYMRVIEALSQLGEIETFLVESDSEDQTIASLNYLKSKFENFNYISMGQLCHEIPDRVERIRFCRNVYINYIRNKNRVSSWDFIVVADLDGMNPKISAEAFLDSIEKLVSWDALFANQKFGYYDIFALRCDGWVETDLLKKLQIEKKSNIETSRWIRIFSYLQNQRKRQRLLYSQMRKVSKKADVIRVNSAFGGLGIYKAELFLRFDYSLHPGESPDGSEHVTFHKKCVQNGYSLGINPKMINAHFNEYNMNKLFAVRFLRDFKRSIRYRLVGRR